MERWLTSSFEDRELALISRRNGVPGFFIKPLVLYDVDRGVVMEPMQGKLASSQFDFVYTEQFCIPAVISVFFSSCDSVVGDSLEFNQAN